MHLVLLSFHVKDIGVEGLTRVALKSEDRTAEFSDFMKELGAAEGFYLSTCNRTEFLFAFEKEPYLDLMGRFGFQPRFYTDKTEIVKHLLGVALSKDSVVFGESQILGQFKRAYDQALQAHLCGGEISPLLNAVIREAKSVRTRVGLTQCHTSISTVAGQLFLNQFGNKKTKVLFVGAGETNQIFAKYISKRHKNELVWTSRTSERSAKAAQDLTGTTWSWEQTLAGKLPECDVMVVATHAQEILVHEAGLKSAKPKLVIDLAVPANVSETAAQKLGISYCGIDRLNEELTRFKSISGDLLRAIDAEIAAASAKILNELEVRDSRSIFADISASSERIWEKELETLVSGKFANMTTEQKAAITEWSRKLVRKVNHVQFQTLRSLLTEDDTDTDTSSSQVVN